MANIDLNQVIEEQVNSKVAELSTWKEVRWEGGRLYYETQKIIREIKDYDIETQLLYLEKLLSRTFVVQDNWPHSAPDITVKLKNWIQKTISKLKIHHLQTKDTSTKSNSSNKGESIIQKQNRVGVPYKIKARLQKEVSSKCPFCSNADVDHFQIHHVDENPQNNVFENLLMVCPTCHSKITKRDISQAEVIKMKNGLLTSGMT